MEEENDFISKILNTDVWKITMDFLKKYPSKNGQLVIKNNDDMKKLLKAIWFNQYPRKRRAKINTSCGFEHVFLGELKDGKVIGLHNWIFFLLEELDGNLIHYFIPHICTSIYLSVRKSFRVSLFHWLQKMWF